MFRNQVRGAYGEKFVKACDTDLASLHPIIRDNINIIVPENGMKVERLIKLAEHEGMKYEPSEKNRAVSICEVKE